MSDGAEPSEADLKLVAEVNGVATTDIATSNDDIVPLFDGKPGQSHAPVNWSLQGDVFASPELLRFSPIYFVRHLSSAASAAGQDSIAVDIHWYLGPECWPCRDFSGGGILVVAWIVDGHPVKVAPSYVGAVQIGSHDRTGCSIQPQP